MKKATAQDMQDIHDFAQKRGAFVKYWDQAKTALVIAREPDTPSPPEVDTQGTDECPPTP